MVIMEMVLLIAMTTITVNNKAIIMAFVGYQIIDLFTVLQILR